MRPMRLNIDNRLIKFNFNYEFIKKDNLKKNYFCFFVR